MPRFPYVRYGQKEYFLRMHQSTLLGLAWDWVGFQLSSNPQECPPFHGARATPTAPRLREVHVLATLHHFCLLRCLLFVWVLRGGGLRWRPPPADTNLTITWSPAYETMAKTKKVKNRTGGTWGC